MALPENQIITGDCLKILKDWPDDCISCCISSPPYWALRDYGVDGQLGLEKTFEEYIEKLCTIYDEVKRVLRKDGTCFVNLGDTYNNVTPGSRDKNRWPKQSRNDHTPNNRLLPANLQTKSLCLIPQRFAIEMVNRGWILRNVIIWHKPNPMPSSARDRFTVDFEYVYFFVKNKKYWFEPQYEPFITESNAERPRMGQGQNTQYKQKRELCGNWHNPKTPNDNRKRKRYEKNMSGSGTNIKGHSGNINSKGELIGNPALGRNKRCVWTIPTQPFPEAHFATYPEKLVEPMIKAGCPEFICSECGKARKKVFDKEVEYCSGSGKAGNIPNGKYAGSEQALSGTYDIRMGPIVNKHFQGYTVCKCGKEFRPGIVLDMFRWKRDNFTGRCAA